ncbi:uncharacterized protein LOC128993934 [Macrosteles quadrilineatus]|uniref:uncharacterized protein LOC128993934 n=1 Tax=Macrosteles quadrilineatus TaxID=74068 RepID=UPI0023E2CD7C|nr:uncharacterized protein LOC128993934 [Macrosteles quadrilineatus]
MKTFHHVFVMCVVAFIAWEATAAEIKQEMVQFEEEVLTYWDREKGVSEWKIEVATVESESEYVSRHTLYGDKKLAIFYFNHNIDPVEHDDQTNKVYAAKDFARFGVENGLYLIVPKNMLTDDFRQRNKIRSTNYLWFDLEEKYIYDDVTDKLTYEKRYDNEVYQDRRIYTLFHKYQPGCKTKKGEDCLEAKRNYYEDHFKFKYNSSYDKVVLLTVHVDVVQEDFLKDLCPKLGAPLEYPALYHESLLGLYEVTGKFSGTFSHVTTDYSASQSCYFKKMDS